jgi:hypothetical protein
LAAFGFAGAGTTAAAVTADTAGAWTGAGLVTARDFAFEVVVAMVAAPFQDPEKPGSIFVALQHES